MNAVLSARLACSPKKMSLPAVCAAASFCSISRRNSLESTSTGRKKLGLVVPIRRQTAARHDHVHMRMMRHGRAPGVQHRGDGDPGAQVLGVGGNRQHGLG